MFGIHGLFKMAWAREDYQYYEKESFQFESCYEVLKDTPNFSLSMTRLDNLHHYQNYDFSNVGSSIRRPPGRKAAEKERAKKKSKQSMDLQHEQSESDRNRRMNLWNKPFTELLNIRIRESELNIRIRESELDIRESELSIRESELNFRIREEEDRIMFMDTSNMTDEQKLHLESCREHIMARKRNGPSM